MVQKYFDDIREQMRAKVSFVIEKDIFDRELWEDFLLQHKRNMEMALKGKVEYFAWIYTNDENKFVMHHPITNFQPDAVAMNFKTVLQNANYIPKWNGQKPIGYTHFHPNETIDDHKLSSADYNGNRALYYGVMRIQFTVLGVTNGIIIYTIDGGITKEKIGFPFLE